MRRGDLASAGRGRRAAGGSFPVTLDGSSSTNFLNTDTTESSRAVVWDSANSGNSHGAIENNQAGYGMDVVDPNGVTVVVPDGLTGAVNLFGSNCLLAGFVIVP